MGEWGDRATRETCACNLGAWLVARRCAASPRGLARRRWRDSRGAVCANLEMQHRAPRGSTVVPVHSVYIARWPLRRKRAPNRCLSAVSLDTRTVRIAMWAGDSGLTEAPGRHGSDHVGTRRVAYGKRMHYRKPSGKKVSRMPQRSSMARASSLPAPLPHLLGVSERLAAASKSRVLSIALS